MSWQGGDDWAENLKRTCCSWWLLPDSSTSADSTTQQLSSAKANKGQPIAVLVADFKWTYYSVCFYGIFYLFHIFSKKISQNQGGLNYCWSCSLVVVRWSVGVETEV